MPILGNIFNRVSTWNTVVSQRLLAPTSSTSSAVKNAHSQFPGPSASLVETEGTPKEREWTLMPLNPQMELANWNITLI
jgi:hypothetical protein